MRNKYTKELLEKAIAANKSMAGVMRYFGVRQSGGLHYHLLLRAREWNIDMSHFVGPAGGFKENQSKIETKPLNDVCVEHSSYSRCHLKRRLIGSGKLKNECNICGQIPEWRGKRLAMVMDHINGERDDNRIENLRLLCPNCNSQQNTFCRKKSSLVKRICSGGCGRTIAKRNKTGFCSKCLFKNSLKKFDCPSCGGIKKRDHVVCDRCKEGHVPELAAGVEFRTPCESHVGSNPIVPTNLANITCPECGGWRTVRAPRCKNCAHKNHRKVLRPTIDELNKMVETMSMCAIGRKYGVSDNAVRKWMKNSCSDSQGSLCVRGAEPVGLVNDTPISQGV